MVWLILGPSGAGKSSFGQWLNSERNWLHIEIDRFPEGDGIALNNLSYEWNAFCDSRNGEPLRVILRKRLEERSKAHGVMTFPGNLVLSPDHMDAATQTGIRTIYLYGSAAHCITAFLDRERQTGGNLDLSHWILNNKDSYLKISEPVFASSRIHVFTHTGTRRPHTEVFEALIHG